MDLQQTDFHAKLRKLSQRKQLLSKSDPEATNLLRGLFRTKNLDDILAASHEEGRTLKRALGAFNVTLIGIGAIIGAGIFATVGTAAAGDASRPGAGPSLMISFVITAVVCGFAALCYAEFASMVPISGSAYTYSYATLGELVAWIIGWDLIIEYALGNVAVAISWANYFRTLVDNLFEHLGINAHVPLWLSTDYRTAAKIASTNPEQYAKMFADAPHIFGHAITLNLLAFAIVAGVTIVLVWGIRESANFNAGMVIIKIVVLLFFIGTAIYFVSPSKMAANWVPFQPNGWRGTFTGAALVFFAYIGFDAVSTVAEETRNPSRDLPIGIIASLIICTVLYVIVGAVFAGLISYPELIQRLTNEQAEPLTMALQNAAPPGVTWPATVVAFGSVVAHTAVLLVFQMGQPRIFFSMARDGLLPPVFAKVHPRFKTPYVTTILTGVVVGAFAAIMSIDEMVDLTNVGTLFAFLLVSIGIIVLRYKDPKRKRPFRVPFGAWLIPSLGVVSYIFLMYYLPPASWWRFVAWLLLGFAVYLSYGYGRSEIGQSLGRTKSAGWLKALATESFLVAVGLLAMPHDETLKVLFSQLGNSTRTTVALGMIGVGIVLSVVSALTGMSQRQRT